MSKLWFKNGVASVIARIRLLDTTSTVGGGKTGLTFASSGLIISTIADDEASATTYTAAGSTIETITTLGTFAAPTATKCRFKEVDATNFAGLYEIQIADARYAVSNARSLIISVQAAGAALEMAEVQLTTVDPYDGVHFGITALPNAAAGASGGVPTVNGSNQVAGVSGNVVGSVGSVVGAVGSVTGNVGGNVTGSVGSVVGAVGSVTGNVGGNVVGTVASVVGNLGGNVVGNVNGNVVGSVGSVTAGVTLAAAAITAIWDKATSALTTVGSIGKFLVDKLTTITVGAYAAGQDPATLVLDVAAASHNTAGTIGAAINNAGSGGGGATAAQVWAYAYRTLTTPVLVNPTGVDGTTITVLRGNTISFSITGLGSLVGRSALYFTAKNNLEDLDSAAILQITELGGLLILNGAAYAGSSSDASLTVDDATAGNITIVLKPAAAKLLVQASGFYDVEAVGVGGAGIVSTLTGPAVFRVAADVTRAVS